MHDPNSKLETPVAQAQAQQSQTANDGNAAGLGIRLRLEADVSAAVIRSAAAGPRPRNARQHFLEALEALNEAYSEFINSAAVHLGTTFNSVFEGLGSATFSRESEDSDRCSPIILTMVRTDNVPALDVPDQDPVSPAILDERFWSIFQDTEGPLVCPKCQAPAVIRVTHAAPADTADGALPTSVRKQIVITYNCSCQAFGADTLTLIRGGKDDLPRGQLSLGLDVNGK